MRRKLPVFTVCLGLVLAMLISVDIGFEVAPRVRAAIIYVGGVGPGNYSTIQEGVDAAGSGDMIFIYSGNYDGPVEIVGRDNLTFIGEDMDTTKVIGGPNPDLSPGVPTYPAVHVQYSSSIVFEELNFWSDYFPLIIDNSNNITIGYSSIGGSQCWVTKVDCIGSFNIHIKNTRFWEEGPSNDLWAHFDSDDILIEYCTFEHWPYSAYFGDYRDADFWVNDDSHVFILDCDTDFRSNSVSDTSTFTVGWYLTVNVMNTNGDPIEGVTVWVRDVFSLTVNLSLTNWNGRVDNIIIKEFVKNSTSEPYHTPHNITAIKNSLRGFADPEPFMNTNRVVTITLNESYDSVQLSQGFNLISFNRIQTNTTLQPVLQSIEGQYTAVQWYDSSDFTDPWKHYHVSKPPHMNDLSHLNHLMGFWVWIDEPGGATFVFNGTYINIPQFIPLCKGWNLVGYPSTLSKLRNDALNNLTFGTDVDLIQTYNARTQNWEDIGENNYLELGKGYWIHAKNDCVWEVPL